MTSEQTRRNVDLAFELVRKAVRDPDAAKELDQLAKHGPIVLLPQDDPELAKSNRELAERAKTRGQRTRRLEFKVAVTKPR